MATIDDIAGLLKSAGLDPRQANGILEAFRLSLVNVGGGNSVLATVDFGASFTHYASASVAATWVTAGSEIVVTPLAASGQEVETALLSFNPVVSDLTAGVGFTLHVYTPIEAKGTYSFSCVGV